MRPMRTQAYVQSEAATGSLNVWAVAPELKPADRLQFYCDNVSVAWSFRDIGVTDQDIREKGLFSGLGLSTASNGSVSGGRYWIRIRTFLELCLYPHRTSLVDVFFCLQRAAVMFPSATCRGHKERSV